MDIQGRMHYGLAVLFSLIVLQGCSAIADDALQSSVTGSPACGWNRGQDYLKCDPDHRGGPLGTTGCVRPKNITSEKIEIKVTWFYPGGVNGSKEHTLNPGQNKPMDFNTLIHIGDCKRSSDGADISCYKALSKGRNSGKGGGCGCLNGDCSSADVSSVGSFLGCEWDDKSILRCKPKPFSTGCVKLKNEKDKKIQLTVAPDSGAVGSPHYPEISAGGTLAFDFTRFTRVSNCLIFSKPNVGVKNKCYDLLHKISSKSSGGGCGCKNGNC